MVTAEHGESQKKHAESDATRETAELINRFHEDMRTLLEENEKRRNPDPHLVGLRVEELSREDAENYFLWKGLNTEHEDFLMSFGVLEEHIKEKVKQNSELLRENIAKAVAGGSGHAAAGRLKHIDQNSALRFRAWLTNQMIVTFAAWRKRSRIAAHPHEDAL